MSGLRSIPKLALAAFSAVALSGVFSVSLAAQAKPAAPPKTYAIRGGKIFTLAGLPIENGTVLIRDGKIAAVGADVSVPSDAEIVDATGLEVYPGLFDAADQLGLSEIEAVSATRDAAELGEFNPQLMTADAVHPASEHIPVAREVGITHAVSIPGGEGFSGGSGMIPGQASAIHLAGWTIDEMLLKRSVGMMVAWPRIQTRTFDFSTLSFKERPFADVKKEQEKKIGELTSFFERARHYQQAVEKGSADAFERDLKLEAFIPVFKGELPLVISAENAREIKGAIEFCDKQKVRMVLAGGSESYKVKGLLKEKKIPVILGPTLSLPNEEDDPYDRSFTLPAELHAAGVEFAIATFDVSNARRLPQHAGVAVAFGLPHDEGIKAISLYPAQILGLGDKLGSIEAGKIANLIVTTGDPLEIRNEVRFLFIAGRLTSTDNKHRQLYEKYRKRP